MINSPSNLGMLNEYLIIEELNGKRVCDVNFLFQDLLYSFFKNINEYDFIKAYKGMEYEKTDVIVKIGNEVMNISVKMGIKNSVHCENVYYFLNFLKNLNIPESVINKYLLYHYADGTMNGTGKNRISADAYKKDHMDDIDYINKYFNNGQIMEKIANRLIFKGTKDKYSLVDVILWGTPNDFCYVFRDEVIDYLKNSCKLYMTCPHFGRLSVQNSNRCLNFNPKGERRRKHVAVKWYNIFDSIIEIMNDRLLNKAEPDFFVYCNKLTMDIMNDEYNF